MHVHVRAGGNDGVSIAANPLAIPTRGHATPLIMVRLTRRCRLTCGRRRYKPILFGGKLSGGRLSAKIARVRVYRERLRTCSVVSSRACLP